MSSSSSPKLTDFGWPPRERVEAAPAAGWCAGGAGRSDSTGAGAIALDTSSRSTTASGCGSGADIGAPQPSCPSTPRSSTRHCRFAPLPASVRPPVSGPKLHDAARARVDASARCNDCEAKVLCYHGRGLRRTKPSVGVFSDQPFSLYLSSVPPPAAVRDESELMNCSAPGFWRCLRK